MMPGDSFFCRCYGCPVACTLGQDPLFLLLLPRSLSLYSILFFFSLFLLPLCSVLNFDFLSLAVLLSCFILHSSFFILHSLIQKT